MLIDPQTKTTMVKLFGVSIDIPNPIQPNPSNSSTNENPKPNLKRLVIRMKNKFEAERFPVELYNSLRWIGVDIVGVPQLFFSRELQPSDVDKGLARLAIPRTKIIGHFLTPEEEEFLKHKGVDGRRLNRLGVKVVDTKMVVRTLSLSRWNYHSSSQREGDRSSWSYALNGGWMNVVRSNHLKKGIHIQLWSFRISDGSLGIIIKVVKPEELSGFNCADDGKEIGCSSSSDGGDLRWGRKRRRGSNRKSM